MLLLPLRRSMFLLLSSILTSTRATSSRAPIAPCSLTGRQLPSEIRSSRSNTYSNSCARCIPPTAPCNPKSRPPTCDDGALLLATTNSLALFPPHLCWQRSATQLRAEIGGTRQEEAAPRPP